MTLNNKNTNDISMLKSLFSSLFEEMQSRKPWGNNPVRADPPVTKMMHYFHLTHKSIACYFQPSHIRNRGSKPSVCRNFYHFEPKLIENQRRRAIFILNGFFKN